MVEQVGKNLYRVSIPFEYKFFSTRVLADAFLQLWERKK